MTTKRKKNKSYNPIRNINEDWELDDRNNKPYSGESVQAFIKQKFREKVGDVYYDSNTTKCLLFADAEARALYLSDRTEYAELLLGSFDAPANYEASITLTTEQSNVVLKGDTGNFIDFTFDIVNKSGDSTGESVVVQFNINNGGNVKKVTQVFNAEEEVHFLIDNYLSTGTNNITIVVTGRNTLASVMAGVTFTVVELALTSDLEFTKAVEVGGYLQVPYTLQGAGVKYVQWFVDGVADETVENISDLKASRTKNIDTTGMTPGKHNVQVRAYQTIGGVNFYSKTLYFDFVVAPADELWDVQGNQLTYLLLGMVLSEPATNGISVSAKQYDTVAYKVGMYDWHSRNLSCLIKDNNVEVQTVTLEDDEIQEKEYTPLTSGSHVLTFTAGGDTATFTATATAQSLCISEETSDRLLRLSAKGRNNTEATPNVWTDGQVATTFNGIGWNEQSGWVDGALVIPAGSSIEIGMAPLGNNPVSKGRTIEIEYAVEDVEDDDAVVMNLINSNTNAGIEMTATSAKLQSSGGTQINTKFRDGERIHLSFIVNKTTGDDACMMYIVNNGKVERAACAAVSDNFDCASNMVIGCQSCKVKLYNIAVYDKALLVDKAFQNWGMRQDNFVQIARRNDILNANTGRIDPDKVNAQLPILKITGDMEPIFSATTKNVSVLVDVEYSDLQDPDKNFTGENVEIKPQGTSSLGYPRKNLDMNTNAAGTVMRDSKGEVIEDGKYAFKNGAQPVNYWCFKADFAESSGSHNTVNARFFNDLFYNCKVGNTYPLRTAAQTAAIAAGYKYDVRTAIDGFPIVIFYRPDENSEYICLGQYNFNNSKKTESVFGFKDIPGFDNTNVQCFEVLGNENPIALFDDLTNWDADITVEGKTVKGWAQAFESRYPDTKTPNLTPLKTMAQWVNSCKTTDPILNGNNEQVYANGQAKFDAEITDHFDVDKCAGVYVYLMRKGAVDQIVKNLMWFTEDGVHWSPITLYDCDSTDGIDNISTVLNQWGYDRQTQKAGGAYIYAGHNSVFWNRFEASAACMARVKVIDNALYSAGLTYANLLKAFDEEQCDKWCERIYNDNSRYKYILPFLEKGSEVLYMLQGDRKSYRHWWLKNRMEMFDALWATAAYTNRVVRFIAEGAPANSQFSIKAAKASYFGYGINAVAQETGVSVAKGSSHEFTIGQALAIGDPVNIYNAQNVSEVDLSDMATYMTTLYLENALDENGESHIKKLTLGDGTATNVKFTGIGGLATARQLEELDIRGFNAINNINFGALQNLHVLKAVGSGLTSFAPAEGATLTNIQLPATLQTLVLDSCDVTALSVEDYTAVDTSPLRNVTMRNLTGSFDIKAFITAWLADYTDEQLANFSLTLTGINWTNVSADTLIHWGHIGTKSLSGTVTLSSMSYSQYQTLVELFGSSAFSDYASFRIIAPAGMYFTGPTTLKYGQNGQFTCVTFPDTSAEVEYQMYNGSTKVPTQWDGQGRAYATFDGVTLYEETGVVQVASNISNNVYLNIKAHIKNTETYSSEIQLTANKATYPTSISINGSESITSNGIKNYTKSVNGSYNANVTSIVWSITSNNACSITASDSNGATVTATNTPATQITVTLTCTMTFDTGQTVQGSKDITVGLTFPTAVSISGNASIDANGNYDYTWAETGSKTADVLSVVWNLTSNEYVTCSGDNTKATVGVAGGNPTAANLTLTLTVTYTGNVTRTATKDIAVAVIAAPPTEDWVDLGLPSGLLWCRHDVGATAPEEAGLYFAWGETTGYVDAAARNTALGRSDGFSSDAYTATGGAAIIDSVLTLEHDAANVNMGLDWRTPTSDEILELYRNTNITNIAGGIKLTSKADSSKFIILRTAGLFNGTVRNYSSVGSALLTSTSNTPGWTYSATPVTFGMMKYYGYNIRPVRSAPKAIDLGLPSGTLWCDRNVGATAPEEAGLYFAWGETEGYKDADDRNAKLTAETGTTYTEGFDQTSYNRAGGASGITGDLTSANDAATKNFGGSWRMPTEEDVDELFDNTIEEWGTKNGIYGSYFYKKDANGNKISDIYIFLPANGNYDEMLLKYNSSYGFYFGSKYFNSTKVHIFGSNKYGYVKQYDNGIRYLGCAIRPVQ